MKVGEYYNHFSRQNDYAFVLDLSMEDQTIFAYIVWSSDGFRERIEAHGFTPFTPQHEDKLLCSLCKIPLIRLVFISSLINSFG